MATITKPLTVYFPDSRGVEISPYMKGNTKIGTGVYTYSRLAGQIEGTCPGASEECEAICYAKRITGAVRDIYAVNSQRHQVPPIPADCRLLRLHVSGDFDTLAYIESWIDRIADRPDVTMWVYTRSWRVPALLPALERLRALPNVQMFASMDVSVPEMPPDGWRRAWIDGDPRQGDVHTLAPAHSEEAVALGAWSLQATQEGTKALICPEETKAVPNCENCGYCFKGQRNDVVFLRH